MRPVALSLTFVPGLISFLIVRDRFRAGGRPPVTKVRVEFDSSGSCCRGNVDIAATVGLSLLCESVDELGVANVAELTVPIEGVDADIVVRDDLDHIALVDLDGTTTTI